MVIGYRDCGILVLIWFRLKKKKKKDPISRICNICNRRISYRHVYRSNSFDKIWKLCTYIIEVKIDFYIDVEIKERDWGVVMDFCVPEGKNIIVHRIHRWREIYFNVIDRCKNFSFAIVVCERLKVECLGFFPIRQCTIPIIFPRLPLSRECIITATTRASTILI